MGVAPAVLVGCRGLEGRKDFFWLFQIFFFVSGGRGGIADSGGVWWPGAGVFGVGLGALGCAVFGLNWPFGPGVAYFGVLGPFRGMFALGCCVPLGLVIFFLFFGMGGG